MKTKVRQADYERQLEASKAQAPTVTEVLEERGKRYGKFADHAAIVQEIKEAMGRSPNWMSMTSAHREALEMIAHKMGRIVNGDPNYEDNWVDIQGYAKLALDTCVSA